ncbi:MAG: LarC family nickel insertion protein [Inquilinaceae bacterium]
MTALPPIALIDLDPVGGIAGDMFAAALLDAFPEREAPLRDDLAKAGLPQGVAARTEQVRSGGFRAARFQVAQETTHSPPRTLPSMTAFLHGGGLAPAVRDRAVALFALLAEAEAKVHGKPLDAVHFHEVSDWDSVVDLVAAASLIAGLDGASWRVGPLPLGGGTVTTAHGRIPVPAPATAELLRDFAWIDDGVPGERVTPTGAAILRHLMPAPTGTTGVGGRLARIGVGCGQRTLPDRPNILRALAFAGTGGTASDEDTVARLAFEIDDMTGEELAVALDRLRALDGVLDVMQVPVIGKKGRAGAGVRVLARPDAAEAAADACLLETSTLGVRSALVRRRLAPRRDVTVDVDGDAHGAKLARRPDGVVTAKADSDGVSGSSSLARRRDRARAVERRAATEDPDG